MIAPNQDQGFDLEPLGEKPPASTSPRMLVPLFLVPLLIVAVVVGLFLGISALVGGEINAAELVQRVESGGFNDRWQAAGALADLAVRSPEELQDPALRNRIRRAFELAGNHNPELRQYLAKVMGILGDKEARPLFEQVIEEHLEARESGVALSRDPDQSGRVLIDCLVNLGRLGDPAGAELLLRLTNDEDAGIRKVVASALGDLHRNETERPAPTLAALRQLHEDPDAWVRMNAALSLAKLGQTDGVPTLEFMLNRSNLAQHGLSFPDNGEMTVGNHDPAYWPILYALVSLKHLGESSATVRESGPLLASLRQVADQDPNGELRSIAAELLESFESPTANNDAPGGELRDS